MPPSSTGGILLLSGGDANSKLAEEGQKRFSITSMSSANRSKTILTVVDTYSRLSPVIDPRFSYRGENVVATLEQACRKIGYPKTIRVDNVLGREAAVGQGQQVSLRRS